MRTFVTYAAILIATLFFLSIVKFFNISYPLEITTTDKSTELAVVGEGKIEVVPDSASVDVGITIMEAGTVEAAQKTIDETNNNIITAMKALGISKTDIKTSNYSINPSYNYEGGRNKLNGYSGNATISIKVKDIKLLSKVVEDATKAGANQVFGTRFNVENPQKYREEARNKAIANAKEQANNLARNLGISLGKVVNIVETSPAAPIYSSKLMVAQGAGGGSEANFEPGSQTIYSTVTLYFEKR